jgi:FKBP-type peptidyl-prolyl cis-trans isomerase FklB
MSLSRALVVAFVAVFGLTACVFDLGSGGGDKPAQAERPDYLPPRDEANWAKMQAFLADYKKKEGVQVLENGIAIRWLHKGPGKGRKATWASTIIARYKGSLVDGTVFDETKPGAPPAEFELNGLVKCWQEVVPLMRDGDKVEAVLPSEYAYGRAGRPPLIKSDQVLIFEIELVGIK